MYAQEKLFERLKGGLKSGNGGWVLEVGYWVLVIGCKAQVVGYWVLVVGCCLLEG